MGKNSPSGSSVFALAIQKMTFLTMIIKSIYRPVGINSLLACLYSARARWDAALRCSTCSESVMTYTITLGYIQTFDRFNIFECFIVNLEKSRVSGLSQRLLRASSREERMSLVFDNKD